MCGDYEKKNKIDKSLGTCRIPKWRWITKHNEKYEFYIPKSRWRQVEKVHRTQLIHWDQFIFILNNKYNVVVVVDDVLRIRLQNVRWFSKQLSHLNNLWRFLNLRRYRGKIWRHTFSRVSLINLSTVLRELWWWKTKKNGWVINSSFVI